MNGNALDQKLIFKSHLILGYFLRSKWCFNIISHLNISVKYCNHTCKVMACFGLILIVKCSDKPIVTNMIQLIYHNNLLSQRVHHAVFHNYLVVKILFQWLCLVFLLSNNLIVGRPSGTGCQLLTVRVRLRGWLYVFFLDILLHPFTPLLVLTE